MRHFKNNPIICSFLLLALVILAACSTNNVDDNGVQPTRMAEPTPQAEENKPTAESPTETPPPPTPFDESSLLNPFHHILGAVPAPEDWHIIPCDGEAAYLCVFKGEEVAGFVELLTFPLANQTILLEPLAEYGLAPGEIDTNSQAYRDAVVPVLELFVADQLASVAADRAVTFGDTLQVAASETRPIQFGNLPGVVYGFTSLDENNAVIEHYITYAAFDADNLYLIGATSDPAAISNFPVDEDLVTFAPYMEQIVAALNFPPNESD
jgi:hypothetical protein